MPLWAESIFGVDVIFRVLEQVVEFFPNCARLFDLTRLVYMQMLADDDTLNRKVKLEMLNYYVFSMLWARMIDIKAKRAHSVLTETERNLRTYITDRE